MEYLKAYLDRIENRGNSKLAESILHTAEEVGNKYLKKFSFTSIETGLLLGNVQSGKTGQVFGIMSKAADLGFPLFLLLTTDNVTLQQQTLERVMADLNDFCICGENDSILFDSNSLEKPTIVVLKRMLGFLNCGLIYYSRALFYRGIHYLLLMMKQMRHH